MNHKLARGVYPYKATLCATQVPWSLLNQRCFFRVERHWAAPKLSLCPKRYDYLWSLTYDHSMIKWPKMVQMAQKTENMSNLTAHIPMIGDSCGLLKCFSLRLVDWEVLCLRIQVLWQLQSCSVQDGPPLHLFCRHPGGCYAPAQRNWADSKLARALGFSPLPNASNENNKQKVLRVAAELHYNHRTGTLITYIHQY